MTSHQMALLSDLFSDMPDRTTRRGPLLMGIVNVTPDSFSDGGRLPDAPSAIDHALRLLDDGADIVDIGGESTRPPGRDYGAGSAQVDSDEEMRRVLPVIEGIRRLRPEAVISIDTMKPIVARRAVDAGAGIINDVSAGSFDPEIRNVAADYDVPYILMHGHDPHDRRPAHEYRYDDIVTDVKEFLRERISRTRDAGVRNIVADVGIGFAKGKRENLELLRRHREFLTLGVPMLVGASRKSFIGSLLGGLPPDERLFGTLGANAAAVLNGASILRAHDIRAAREFFTVFLAVAGIDRRT